MLKSKNSKSTTAIEVSKEKKYQKKNNSAPELLKGRKNLTPKKLKDAVTVNNPISRIFSVLSDISGCEEDITEDLLKLSISQKTDTLDKDSKRKALRQIFDLKRVLEKEGSFILQESALQKRLFAKNNDNISVLIKVLNAYKDLECSHAITSILLKILNFSELGVQNATFLAKRGLSQMLFENIIYYYPKCSNHQVQGISATQQQKLDEFNATTIALLVKLSKADPKLALLARLTDAIPTLIDILFRFHEKRDFTSMMSTVILLKAIAKNENSLVYLQKSDILVVVESTFALSSSYANIRLEPILELVLYLGKSTSCAQEILRFLSMKQLLGYCSSSVDTISKAGLKVLKLLITYAMDSGNITQSGSITSLLVSVLRATVKQSDLPFMDLNNERTFPLPRPPSTQPLDEPSFQTLDSPEKLIHDPSSPVDLKNEERTEYAPIISKLTLALFNRNSWEMFSELEQAVSDQLKNVSPEISPLKTETPCTNIRVRHVQPMYPGKHMFCKHTEYEVLEPLLKKSQLNMKKVISEQITKIFKPPQSGTPVYNVMDPSVSGEGLVFESRFESGNLQLAIKYDLLVQSDVNAPFGKHNQWFYFSVAGMTPNVPYKFNILNLSKPGSQFNNGMQPLVYSLADPIWKRMGESVYYIKNHYRKSEIPSIGKEGGNSELNTYATLTFTLTFKAANDTCYIAYHYPYTFSDLQRFLYRLFRSPNYSKRCYRSTLCNTLGGNECPLLTITDFESTNAIPKKYVFLSARVHPGESIITFLLSDDERAVYLRQNCIFKIIPMLNPDGVLNGNHRCSLAGVDLNRQWKKPSRVLTPTIFWAKTLYDFLIKLNGQPIIACDFHGHSRKKNIFMFGNESGRDLEKMFPQLLAYQNSMFDFASCRYNIVKSKEATARVVLFREFGIINSYTIESTYCGFDMGQKKGMQIQLQDLLSIGQDFCITLFGFIKTESVDLPLRPNKPDSASSKSSNNIGKKKKRTKRTKKVKEEEDEDENPSDDSSSGDEDDDL